MPIWLIQILVGVAASVLGQLFSQSSKQDQQQKVAGVRGSLQSGGDLAPRFIIGRYGSAGQLRYAGTWGNAGEVPNAYYSKVIEVSCLPIRGFTGWFVNGERVTLATGKTGNLGYAVLEFRVGGVDHLWINPYTGAQTAEDPLMMAHFGGDPERPYAGLVGRGTGYFVATALLNRELFSGFPEYLAEVDGIVLNDPRGDGQHDNPIVAAYTLLRGLSYGGDWVYGPQRYSLTNFRSANLESEADKCDALRPGSTQKRYRIGLDVALDEEPHAVVGELLKACSGRWADLGGVFRFLVGAPGAPVVAITDEDVIISEQQTLEPFPGLEDLHNAMSATYPEPGEAWEMKEAPPRYRSDLEASDDSRRLVFSTAFKAVPWAVQVQDLMRTTIEDARRFRRHTQTMPPEFWEYEPFDVVAWTSARNGYVGKSFMITVMDDLPNANQFIGLQENEPGDYDWESSFELPYAVTPLTIARPAPQNVTGFYVEPAIALDSDGNPRRPAIDVFWSAASVTVDVRAVRITVRLAVNDQLVWEGEAPRPELGSARLTEALLANEDYEVQIEYVPHSGRSTVASSWLAVTTPDVRIALDDLTDELKDTVEGVNDWLDVGLPALTDTVEGIDAELAAVQTSVAASFQQVNDALSIVEAQVADLTGVAEHVQAEAYDEDDIVQSGGSLYRAKIAVPANTAITNTTYWEKIGDYASLGEAVAGTANLLTSEVARIDGAISSQSSSITALQNALPGKADASAVNALSTRVTGTENTNTSQGSAITSLQNALPGKADASALTALTTRVTDAENVNSAQGTAITGVQAAVGNQDADANWVKNAMFQAAGELNPVTGTAFTVSFLAATDPSVPAGAPAERVGVLDLLQTPVSNALRSHTFLTKNVSSYVPLTPGDKIVLSVDVCVVNPVGIHQFLMFTRRNASGSATNDRAVRYDAVLGGWQKLVFAYTVPASGVVEARLAVGMDPGPTADRPGAGTKLFFANPVFQKLQAGAAVQAAAQTALDARTTANETAISSTSSALTSLSNVVNDPVSGLAGKVSTAVTDSLAASIQSTTDKLVSRTHDIRRMQNTAASSALLNLMQIGANVETMEATRTEITVTKDGVQAVAERIQSMEAVVGGNLATSLQQIQLLADETSARGTQIDQLRAVVGDSGAEVLIKGEVVSGPGGPGSRYAIRLQTTSNGEVLGSGVFFIDIATDGSSTIGLQASRTVFYTSDGQPFALLNDDKKFRSANGAFEVDMSTGDVTMTRGVIRSDDGDFQINPALKTISIST